MNASEEPVRDLHPLTCPECLSTRIKSGPEEDSFEYGAGADAVQLKVTVPVHRCADCKFAFTDGEADMIRHNAVCAHLGIYNPGEVVAIRKRYGMGQAAFGKISGLGSASLARWETGALMQNAANDTLLYLLSFPENMERLKRRRAVAARKQRVRDSE